MSAHAARFATAARSMLGVRWRHRGRTLRGLDCIGLLWVAARASGLYVEDEFGYGREPWNDRLRAGLQRRFGRALPKAQAREGDIALIAYAGSEPMHVGVVASHPDGGLSLIHSHRMHGVIEQGLRDQVAASVVEIYRPSWVQHVH